LSLSRSKITTIVSRLNVIADEDMPTFVPSSPFKRASAKKIDGGWHVIDLTTELLILRNVYMGKRGSPIFSFTCGELETKYEKIEMSLALCERFLTEFDGYLRIALDLGASLSATIVNMKDNESEEYIHERFEEMSVKAIKNEPKKIERENWGTW